MKPSLFSVLCALPLLAGGLVVLHADGAATHQDSAQAAPFSVTLELRQGQSAAMPAVGGNPASIRLDRVNDSRCRPKAVCVWKGYISYSFTYREGDAGSSFVLAEDMPGASKSITQNGLTFSLAEPAPVRSETTPDYRVSLRVSNTSPP
jgi:hypothetical protein